MTFYKLDLHKKRFCPSCLEMLEFFQLKKTKVIIFL